MIAIYHFKIRTGLDYLILMDSNIQWLKILQYTLEKGSGNTGVGLAP